MVLLAGPGPEGGGARCVSPPPPSPPRDAQARDDPEDPEEYEDFSRLPDTRSLASDDSFHPPGAHEELGAPSAPEAVPEGVPEAATLLRAAGANDVGLLRALIRRGPREEEVRETDRNGRTGLIVACSHGFVDAVVALAECPHIDVNWQDSEGNTALITAAQAGHAAVTSYLLNYFPGLDLERRNALGFSALMKAALHGRTECVRALVLAGADVHARDPRRGMSPAEWAAYTGRLEAVRLIQRLLERPCPEQFGDKYKPELPQGLQGAAKPAASSKNCLQKLARFLRGALGPRARAPQDGGVLDHMVRMTTSHYSPAVAVACQTVCPESPPRVGKRRLAVQEIVQARARRDARAPEEPGQGRGAEPPPPPPPPPRPAQTSGVCGEGSPPRPAGAPRKASLLALHRLRRGSVRPGVVIPRVRVSKAPAPTFQPERPPAKGSTKDSGHLQLPKWRYKEAKEEKRKAEEAERQRAAQAQKERRAPPWRKRT